MEKTKRWTRQARRPAPRPHKPMRHGTRQSITWIPEACVGSAYMRRHGRGVR